jgi:hypothetical protein
MRFRPRFRKTGQDHAVYNSRAAFQFRSLAAISLPDISATADSDGGGGFIALRATAQGVEAVEFRSSSGLSSAYSLARVAYATALC